MQIVLLFILAAFGVVLPATVLYALVQLVRGAHPSLPLLGAGGAIVVVAALLLLGYGKRLVVK